MPNCYHAQPYNLAATGFYFESYEEYLTKSKDLTDCFGDPVEEFSLQFIDGDSLTAHLFKHLNISQGPRLKTWFEAFEGLEYDELLVACFLAEDGYSVEEILDMDLDDVHLFEGTALDYAYDYVESTGMLDGLPKSLQYYFDYDGFARDLVPGDATQWICPENRSYIVTLS